MTLSHRIANLSADDVPNNPTKVNLGTHLMNWYNFALINADFEFWIDQECVIREPYWNIGELAQQLAEWLATGLVGDFHYHCLSAEEENLFTFRWHAKELRFFTEWANDESNAQTTQKVVAPEALKDFIRRFQDDVKARIMRDLGLDVSLFLSS